MTDDDRRIIKAALFVVLLDNEHALGGNRGIDLCSGDEWTLDEVFEDFKNADSD